MSIDDAEVVVELEDVAVVAPQLVGGDAVGLAVVAARRDVEIVVVEEHPQVGGFGGGDALHRKLLDEAVDRRDRGVDFLVEPTVNPQRRGQPDGANLVGRGAHGLRLCGMRCGQQHQRRR